VTHMNNRSYAQNAFSSRLLDQEPDATWSATLPFVIPSEAEGSAVLQACPGTVFRVGGLDFEARRSHRQPQPGPAGRAAQHRFPNFV
jgi:hypothetical protein